MEELPEGVFYISSTLLLPIDNAAQQRTVRYSYLWFTDNFLNNLH
jgi:hypothetical protein